MDQAQAYVTNDHVNLENLGALITILENAFGNSNRVAEAEMKLYTLEQGNRDFAAYYAEFQRYAAEVAWSDSVKLAVLKKGLACHLSNDLVTVADEPAAIADFVTLCNKLDMKRRVLQNKNKLANLNRSTFRPQTTTATPPTVSHPAPASTTTSSGTASGPMDLSANRR